MTTQDDAWEAYRPQAAEHDVTPCRLAFDAGWAASQRDRIAGYIIDGKVYHPADVTIVLKDPS